MTPSGAEPSSGDGPEGLAPALPVSGLAGTTNSVVVLVIVIAALYFGREVLVPLVMAGLLSFALAPVVAFLRRHGLPRIPAVIAVVVCAFAAISVFGLVVAGQVSQLGESLPSYQQNIEEKIKSAAHAGRRRL